MNFDREPNAANIPDSKTNSIIQVIGKELRRLGIPGGLADDGGLRHVVQEMMILTRLAEPQNADLIRGKAPHNSRNIRR